MALFPCSLANVRVSSPPSPEPTPAAIERDRQVKFVYSELAPRMFEKLDPPEVKKVAETIVDECRLTGVDHLFALAIIEAESNFDVEAVSPTGARGLMQLMPGTFREVSDAKRMFDPSENVRAGIRYIAKLYSQGFKRPDTVLLAYNQGPGGAIAVAKEEMEMPEEAVNYIPRVMKKYRELLKKDGKNPKDAKKLFVIAQR